MGNCSLLGMQNLVWHRLIKSHLGQHHTFQHYSDKFKLLNVKISPKQITNVDGIELKPPDVHHSL